MKFQSSIGSKLFENVEKWKEFLFFLKKSEKLKMTAGEGSCPWSSPSGNQVDGSPLVAVPKQKLSGPEGTAARRYSWPWTRSF